MVNSCSGMPLQVASSRACECTADRSSRLRWLLDDKTVITVTPHGDIDLWNVKDGVQTGARVGAGIPVVALSPDGRLVGDAAAAVAWPGSGMRPA